jgi:mono/diheme cytochrome c family protein
VISGFGLVLTLAGALQSPDLAPGEGRDLVSSACTGCHGTELIVAAHMTRKSWDTTLAWMEETQGLTRLEPALRKAILDYLEKTQGLSTEDEETSTPWASPRYRPNPLW